MLFRWLLVVNIRALYSTTVQSSVGDQMRTDVEVTVVVAVQRSVRLQVQQFPYRLAVLQLRLLLGMNTLVPFSMMEPQFVGVRTTRANLVMEQQRIAMHPLRHPRLVRVTRRPLFLQAIITRVR